MKKRKTLAMALACAMAVSLCACGPTGSPGGPSGDGDYNVGVKRPSADKIPVVTRTYTADLDYKHPSATYEPVAGDPKFGLGYTPWIIDKQGEPKTGKLSNGGYDVRDYGFDKYEYREPGVNADQARGYPFILVGDVVIPVDGYAFHDNKLTSWDGGKLYYAYYESPNENIPVISADLQSDADPVEYRYHDVNLVDNELYNEDKVRISANAIVDINESGKFALMFTLENKSDDVAGIVISSPGSFSDCKYILPAGTHGTYTVGLDCKWAFENGTWTEDSLSFNFSVFKDKDIGAIAAKLYDFTMVEHGDPAVRMDINIDHSTVLPSMEKNETPSGGANVAAGTVPFYKDKPHKYDYPGACVEKTELYNESGVTVTLAGDDGEELAGFDGAYDQPEITTDTSGSSEAGWSVTISPVFNGISLFNETYPCANSGDTSTDVLSFNYEDMARNDIREVSSVQLLYLVHNWATGEVDVRLKNCPKPENTRWRTHKESYDYEPELGDQILYDKNGVTIETCAIIDGKVLLKVKNSTDKVIGLCSENITDESGKAVARNDKFECLFLPGADCYTTFGWLRYGVEPQTLSFEGGLYRYDMGKQPETGAGGYSL